MKNKIIILSIFACVFHAVILQTPFNGYVFTSILKISLFFGIPLILLGKNVNVFFKKSKSLKVPFILGVSVIVVVVVIFLILRKFLDENLIISALNHNGITSQNFPYVFIYIVAVNAFSEEFFFRGFVFLTLRNQGWERFSFVYSAVLFALYHVSILNGSMSPAMMAFCVFGLVIAGCIFGELARRYGNIFSGLIVHISANFAINAIVVYYLYF
jgi:membrane protease YdiL (CAAX protease family)